MPVYEYEPDSGKCDICHGRFEFFQKMSDEPRAQCPECGSESERLLSAGAGFLFKGNGFYITDYRSDSYKKDASKEDKATSSGKTVAETKEKEGPSSGSTDSKSPESGTSSNGGGSGTEGG